MDPEQLVEAKARLERDYIAGSIDADEYTRLRRQLEAGPPPAEEQPEPQPESVWAPMPALSPTDWRPVDQGADPVTGVRLASWGRRAGAWWIDLLVYIGAIWAISLLVPTDESGEFSDAAGVSFLVLLFFGPTIYAWLMVGRWGRTLGKMAVGITVVRSEDGRRVSYARALGRAASVWLLGLFFLPLLLAYLWPLWDARNQTLYDKMASTIVTRGSKGLTDPVDAVP